MPFEWTKSIDDRPTADMVTGLRTHATRSTVPTHAELREAADRLAELDAEVTRLMVIATDTQLENEITRALNHIPARCLRDGEPWEEGVRRMREELDEWRTLDPEQRIEQERHNRSIVEDELRTFTDALPPCPTCGGSGTVVKPMRGLTATAGRTIPCPDCKDHPGKASIEQLVADWNDMHGLLAEVKEWFDHINQLGYDHVDSTLRAAIDRHLRSVKP